MANQSLNFVKKILKNIEAGKQEENPLFSYLNNYKTEILKKCAAKSASDFCNIHLIEEAMIVQSSFQIFNTFKKMEEYGGKTK